MNKKLILSSSYVGNGAVGFSERVWVRTLRKSPVDFFSDEPESVQAIFSGTFVQAKEIYKN